LSFKPTVTDDSRFIRATTELAMAREREGESQVKLIQLQEQLSAADKKARVLEGELQARIHEAREFAEELKARLYVDKAEGTARREAEQRSADTINRLSQQARPRTLRVGVTVCTSVLSRDYARFDAVICALRLALSLVFALALRLHLSVLSCVSLFTHTLSVAALWRQLDRSEAMLAKETDAAAQANATIKDLRRKIKAGEEDVRVPPSLSNPSLSNSRVAVVVVVD
jgi:uncharacterized membrane protein